jgi:hypothetical protein
MAMPLAPTLSCTSTSCRRSPDFRVPAHPRSTYRHLFSSSHSTSSPRQHHDQRSPCATGVSTLPSRWPLPARAPAWITCPASVCEWFQRLPGVRGVSDRASCCFSRATKRHRRLHRSCAPEEARDRFGEALGHTSSHPDGPQLVCVAQSKHEHGHSLITRDTDDHAIRRPLALDFQPAAMAGSVASVRSLGNDALDCRRSGKRLAGQLCARCLFNELQARVHFGAAPRGAVVFRPAAGRGARSQLARGHRTQRRQPGTKTSSPVAVVATWRGDSAGRRSLA